MDALYRALKLAGQDLFTPRMLGLVLWPMGLAILFWGLLAWFFGAAWKAEIAAFLASTPLQDLLLWVGAEWLLAYAAVFLIVLLWLPAVYTTALLITSLALMPFIVRYVAEKNHPTLEWRHGGSLTGSVVNGVAAVAIYTLAWLVLLPLWLFAPFGVVVSVLLNAWVNQRLFMYDALSEHASATELARLRHADTLSLYGLSTLLGLLHFLPLVNFFAPVYMGLAFAHYALDKLARERAA